MLQRKQQTFTYLDYAAQPAPGAPVLVMLHGYGSNEKDLIGLAPALDGRLRVISVQAPIGMGGEMYAWFPIEFTENGIRADHDTAKQVLGTLTGFLRELVEATTPAGGKLFIMGFSQGAIMSYLTAFAEPDLLHGVIALSGQLPEERPDAGSMPESLRQLPFLVVHGTYDDVLTIDKGRDAGNWLKEHVSDSTYREYPMAHQIDEPSLAFTAGWLKQRIDRIGA